MNWLPALIATVSACLFVMMAPGLKRSRQTVHHADIHQMAHRGETLPHSNVAMNDDQVEQQKAKKLLLSFSYSIPSSFYWSSFIFSGPPLLKYYPLYPVFMNG